MIENGYKPNESDKCIYCKSWDNSQVIISLYVDDVLIFDSNLHVIYETKNMLSNHFDMKDLGEANFILGMKITKTCDDIFLDQSHYVENLLKKYNYVGCKHVVTLFDLSVCLFSIENDDDVINQKEYASMIGSLHYAADCTRPDFVIDMHGLDNQIFIQYKIYSLFYRKYPDILESVMPIGITGQVILFQLLVIFLLWMMVLYVASLKNKLLLLTQLWKLSL